MCTAVNIGWYLATPPPRIWAHILVRGRYWSAKIDDISWWLPDYSIVSYTCRQENHVTLWCKSKKIFVSLMNCLLFELRRFIYCVQKTSKIYSFSGHSQTDSMRHKHRPFLVWYLRWLVYLYYAFATFTGWMHNSVPQCHPHQGTADLLHMCLLLFIVLV